MDRAGIDWMKVLPPAAAAAAAAAKRVGWIGMKACQSKLDRGHWLRPMKNSQVPRRRQS